MFDEETPETMLRSLLKTRLREEASPEAIHQELKAHGLNAEQIRALIAEVSEATRKGPLDVLLAWLPVALIVLAVIGLGLLYLFVDKSTMAMSLVGLGGAAMSLTSLGLVFAMMVGGHVNRQNVLREYQPDPNQGAMMTPERYLYLFAVMFLGLILVLVGQSLDPDAIVKLQQKTSGQPDSR